MGKEVSKASYTGEDEREFASRVARETDLLFGWAREGRMADPRIHLGHEIEFCLTDHSFLPAMINEKFLDRLSDDRATSELASFNVEFNPEKIELGPGAFVAMRDDFRGFMRRAFNVAEQLSSHLVMMGILPTIAPGDLGSGMVTSKDRYRTFMRKFSEWQDGKMTTITIAENDGLSLGLSTILIEAVTTSHQVHLQVPEPGSGAYYNAAQLLAGPMVALSANSPYFLGRNLWAETRVPLFEQILTPRFTAPGANGAAANDFFGHEFVKESILELFAKNRDDFAHVIPDLGDEDGSLFHLSLHNGTIWRWNRPVFAAGSDGEPTLRIEHRVMPTGTSGHDMYANAAFFVGALQSLVALEIGGDDGDQLERRLPAAVARSNFYGCARDGLSAEIEWFGGEKMGVRELLLDRLLPPARDRLKEIGLLDDEMSLLNTIEARVKTGRNGAQWQRDYLAAHGMGSASVRKMTGTYWRHQLQGMPVHEWSV